MHVIIPDLLPHRHRRRPPRLELLSRLPPRSRLQEESRNFSDIDENSEEKRRKKAESNRLSIHTFVVGRHSSSAHGFEREVGRNPNPRNNARGKNQKMRTLAWISREIGIRWQLEMGRETGFLLVCAAPRRRY